MKKILICGDSFAADWTKKYPGMGWPNMLATEFKVTNLAQAGCSEYKIYKQLESTNLLRYDSIIISHTSPYRLHVNKHPIHSNDPLHKDSDLIYSDIEEHSKSNQDLLPILEYYKKYYDLDYAIFIHNLICEKIDNLTQHFPVLHLINFEWSHLYQFSNMLSFESVFKAHRGNMNHFSCEGNSIVFEEIKKHL